MTLPWKTKSLERVDSGEMVDFSKVPMACVYDEGVLLVHCLQWGTFVNRRRGVFLVHDGEIE